MNRVDLASFPLIESLQSLGLPVTVERNESRVSVRMHSSKGSVLTNFFMVDRRVKIEHTALSKKNLLTAYDVTTAEMIKTYKMLADKSKGKKK